MKIIFFGTSTFAVPALEALNEAGFEISAVITMPDQPVGRKKILAPPPIKIAAEKLRLKVLQPPKLKDDAFFEEFSALGGPASGGKFQPPDFCVVAAYGKIIAERYINTPKYGFLNIHPSLLPKYRGPTPIQTAILNGDNETGITIMQIDKDMDHGPIVASIKGYVLRDKGYQEAHDDLAKLGAKLLVETIPKLISGEIKPKEQDHGQATYCKIFSREDSRIDWSRPSQEIYNQIRALNPEPGTWTTWRQPGSANSGSAESGEATSGTSTIRGDKILNIKAASVETSTSQGKPELKITRIQMEGKKETSITDFVSGHPDFEISQLK